MRKAADAWRCRPDVARVLADCEALAQGADVRTCRDLRALTERHAAKRFALGWVAAMLRAWRSQPLSQVPFRHGYADGRGVLQLHRIGRVTVSLVLVEPPAANAPATVAFTDCARCEIVLAGSGRAVDYRMVSDRPPRARSIDLQPGRRIFCNARRSRAIVALDTPLVALRIARDPHRPCPTQEVAIETGRIVHRASPSASDGRAELAAALLGAMGRADAAPTLAQYARDRAGTCGQSAAGARWEALRHALALDTATGLAALCEIAHSESDPLHAPAEALSHRLHASYPQLVRHHERAWRAS